MHIHAILFNIGMNDSEAGNLAEELGMLGKNAEVPVEC